MEKCVYKRLTNQKWTEDIDLTQELGYSYIYKRLYELENLLEKGGLVFEDLKIEINIYSNYKVRKISSGATKTAYNEFEKFNFDDTYTMNGGKLLESIAMFLNSSDIDEFNVENNKIYIHRFDPNTGEASDCEMYIEEIKEENKEVE